MCVPVAVDGYPQPNQVSGRRLLPVVHGVVLSRALAVHFPTYICCCWIPAQLSASTVDILRRCCSSRRQVCAAHLLGRLGLTSPLNSTTHHPWLGRAVKPVQECGSFFLGCTFAQGCTAQQVAPWCCCACALPCTMPSFFPGAAQDAVGSPSSITCCGRYPCTGVACCMQRFPTTRVSVTGMRP